MRVRVETSAGHGGVEMPRRFCFGERRVEVAENLDQWYGADYRYFRVRGDDGNLYILRLDESRSERTLTLFQSPQAEEISVQPPGRGRRPMPSS